MHGVGERVAARDVELIEADVVQEHIDAAQVVRRGVDLLPVEALAHAVHAQDLGELQQQRARAAGGVVDLVDALLVADDDVREQLRDLLWGEELAARLAGAGGVHVHQVLVRVAEEVDVALVDAAEVEVADADDDLGKALAAQLEVSAELVARHVHVVEQALEVLLGRLADARCLDGLEDARDADVQLRVAGGVLRHVAEQLRGQDEVALVLGDAGAGRLGFLVRHRGVREIVVARFMLAIVDELAEVLRDEPIEQEAEDIRLEVPSVNGAADAVRDAPDGFVQLCLLVLARHVSSPCSRRLPADV